MTRSLPKLLIHATVAVIALAGAAVAIARSGGDTATEPQRKPLAEAVQSALSAPAPAGVSGQIEFHNDLVDADAVPDDKASPLLAGAAGRFWVAGDGRARLELRSDAGAVQLQVDRDRVTLYDASAKTVYRAQLPELPAMRDVPATPGTIQLALARLARTLTFSEAEPGTVAGKPAYTVRLAPRHDGGLVGAAEVAWDVAHGFPLRAAVYAQGEREPVLEVEATEVDFGPVADRDVAAQIPRDARVVEIDQAAGEHDPASVGASAAFDAVQAKLSFPLSAPRAVAGLPRRSLRTVRIDGRTAALATYGKGLGALMVFAAPVDGHRGGLAAGKATGLQELSLDGTTAYELATALGTVVEFERDGVAYTVVGSVPAAAAEAAARAL